MRTARRLAVTLVAFFIAGLFVTLWRQVVPPNALTGMVMAFIAVAVVYGAWGWSARFGHGASPDRIFRRDEPRLSDCDAETVAHADRGNTAAPTLKSGSPPAYGRPEIERPVNRLGRGELIRYAREELGIAIDSHLPIEQIRQQIEYQRAAAKRAAVRPETRSSRVGATTTSRQTTPSGLNSELPPVYGPKKKTSMNKAPRTVLLVTAAVVLLMLLFPPFHFRFGKATFNAGYEYLFDPPTRSSATATVDVAMLMAEWIGAVLIGGLLWWYFKDHGDR